MELEIIPTTQRYIPFQQRLWLVCRIDILNMQIDG